MVDINETKYVFPQLKHSSYIMLLMVTNRINYMALRRVMLSMLVWVLMATMFSRLSRLNLFWEFLKAQNIKVIKNENG